ncbi:MAG: hypothetical protein KBC11_00400 [Candidatus Pacebacteria bacterium]|nr:hypothetical protein [Candidatus Paceibacterota bacterium]
MPKSKGHSLPIAVFDISSSSVAGAHAIVNKEKSSILASTRLFSVPQEDLNVERYINETIEQLDKVISILKKADNHTPSIVQVLLASPWFISQTRTIIYNKDSGFVCSEKLINSLIDKEVAYIIKNDIEKFGNLGKDAIIIEKQISQVKLNGYTTSKPFGKKTKNLELFLVITVSPKFIIDKIKDQLLKNYASSSIKFTTSPYATFVVARDFLQAQEEIMLLDIGEEVTDMALVKNNIFLYQHSFPVGLYKFYRDITKDGKTSLTEAKALVESFRLGKLSANMTSNVQKSLDEFSQTWQKSFQEMIDSSQESIKIPESIYFVCDPRFNSFFEGLLKQDIFLQHATGSTDLNPVAITSQLLSSHISSLDSEKIDETISIATLFSSRIL